MEGKDYLRLAERAPIKLLFAIFTAATAVVITLHRI